MTDRPRDSQRERVYQAEKPLMASQEKFRSVEDCQAFVDEVVDSDWWLARFSRISKITVTDGRSRRRGGAEYTWGGWEIAMPVFSRNRLYLLHEIAHCLGLPTEAWHGPAYAARYLALVERWLGKKAARQLRADFAKEGVRYRGHAVPAKHRDEVRLMREVRAARAALDDADRRLKAYRRRAREEAAS